MLESFVSDKFTYKKIPLEEQKSRGILGRLTGVIADTKNSTRNGRRYSKELWKKVFDNEVMKEKIANRCVFSELGHPTDREEVDLDKVCACLAETPKLGADGKIYGVFDILDTNNGRILKTLCDYGTTVGVSSRGTGDLYTDEDGNEAVDPDTYNCECFDIVIVPAVKEARLQYVTESLDTKKYNKTLRQKLTEELEKYSENDKKIVSESLNDLGINLKINEDYDQEFWDAHDSFLNFPHKDGFDYRIITIYEYMMISNDLTGKDCKTIEEVKEYIRNLDDDIKVEVYEWNGNGNWSRVDLDKNESLNEDIEEITKEEFDQKMDQEGYGPRGLFIFKDGDRFIGVDNSTNDAWTEEFNSEEDCRNWLEGNTEVNEVEERLISKLRDSQEINETYNNRGYTNAIRAISDGIIDDEDLESLQKYLQDIVGYCRSIADDYGLLVESMNESDENKECNSENCADKEEDKEVVNDKSDKELVAEFQESLKQIKKLKEDNLSLQEKLSVCNAKEVELKETLNQYKQATISLSDTAKRVKSLSEDNKKLSEDLDRKGKELKFNKNRFNKLVESTKIDSEKSKKLTESLENKNKDLTSKVENLKESLDKYSKQLEQSKGLLERYKNSYKALKESYLEVKANNYGLRKEEVLQKLNESYKIKDIDSVCEELSKYKQNLNKLPFRLDENIKISARVSDNEYIKGDYKNPDDYVSDSLLHIANIK